MGFEFPVPINDVGNARFLQDKAILFMRWIRKHIDTIEKEKKGTRGVINIAFYPSMRSVEHFRIGSHHFRPTRLRSLGTTKMNSKTKATKTQGASETRRRVTIAKIGMFP